MQGLQTISGSTCPLFAVLQAGYQPGKCMQHVGEHLRQSDLLHSRQDLAATKTTALQPANLTSAEIFL